MSYFQTPWYIVLLLLIALLLFGGKRLPEIGKKSLGHGMREFKDAASGNPKVDLDTPPELLAATPTPAEPTATPTTATPPERETL